MQMLMFILAFIVSRTCYCSQVQLCNLEQG